MKYCSARGWALLFSILACCFLQNMLHPELGFGIALGLAHPRRESRMGRDVAALLQVLNNGVAKLWRMGNAFQLLWANPEFSRLTGHTGVRAPRRRPEKLDWSFIHPDDRGRLLALLPTLERQLSPHTEEFRLNQPGWPSYALTLCCMWTEDDCAMYVCSLDAAASAWHKSDRLQWERRRLILLSNFANEIMFEYNLSTDTLLHYDVLHTLFASDSPIRPLHKYLQENDVVHSEDLSKVLKLLHIVADTPCCSEKFRLRARNNEFQWYQVQCISLDYADGRRGMIGRLMNVHESTEKLAQLERSSCLDPLTEILHKTAVEEAIDLILAQARPGAHNALLVMDIDNFKEINDRYGHRVGDEVISLLVHCLKASFRSSDIFGRIGGDEFVVLLRDIHKPSLVKEKVQRFRERLSKAELGAHRELLCTVSIGVSVAPKQGNTFRELFEAADLAMYQAKADHKGSVVFA